MLSSGQPDNSARHSPGKTRPFRLIVLYISWKLPSSNRSFAPLGSSQATPSHGIVHTYPASAQRCTKTVRPTIILSLFLLGFVPHVSVSTSNSHCVTPALVATSSISPPTSTMQLLYATIFATPTLLGPPYFWRLCKTRSTNPGYSLL